MTFDWTLAAVVEVAFKGIAALAVGWGVLSGWDLLRAQRKR